MFAVRLIASFVSTVTDPCRTDLINFIIYEAVLIYMHYQRERVCIVLSSAFSYAEQATDDCFV